MEENFSFGEGGNLGHPDASCYVPQPSFTACVFQFFLCVLVPFLQRFTLRRAALVGAEKVPVSKESPSSADSGIPFKRTRNVSVKRRLRVVAGQVMASRRDG